MRFVPDYFFCVLSTFVRFLCPEENGSLFRAKSRFIQRVYSSLPAVRVDTGEEVTNTIDAPRSRKVCRSCLMVNPLSGRMSPIEAGRELKLGLTRGARESNMGDSVSQGVSQRLSQDLVAGSGQGILDLSSA